MLSPEEKASQIIRKVKSIVKAVEKDVSGTNPEPFIVLDNCGRPSGKGVQSTTSFWVRGTWEDFQEKEFIAYAVIYIMKSGRVSLDIRHRRNYKKDICIGLEDYFQSVARPSQAELEEFELTFGFKFPLSKEYFEEIFEIHPKACMQVDIHT